jgi:hypothetical protein
MVPDATAAINSGGLGMLPIGSVGMFIVSVGSREPLSPKPVGARYLGRCSLACDHEHQTSGRQAQRDVKICSGIYYLIRKSGAIVEVGGTDSVVGQTTGFINYN